MKKYKIMKIIFWVVLVLGSAGLGVWSAANDLPNNSPIIWGWLIGMALVGIVISQARIFALNKRLMELAPLIRDDPDEYIRRLDELLGNEKSGNFEQVYHMNLGAAYCNKKDYAAAKQWLLRVEPKKLGMKAVRNVYWADLALVHFCLREDAEGCALLEEHREELGDGSEQSMEGLVAMLYVYEQLAKGNRSEARKLMKDCRPLWKNAAPGELDDLKARLEE